MDIIPLPEGAPTFGPWEGVLVARQSLCAVLGCQNEGQPHRCLYDGGRHHHGCIHYDCEAAQATNHGLSFREGWGWLCGEHYQTLKIAAVLRKRESATA